MKLSDRLTVLKNKLSIDEAAYLYPLLSLQKRGFIFKNCEKCNRIFGTCSDGVTQCADHHGESEQIKEHVVFTQGLSFTQVVDKFKSFFSSSDRNFEYTPLMLGNILNPFGVGISHTISGIDSYTPGHLRETDPEAPQAYVDVQFCMRFTDKLENTSRHYIGFNMGGQHIIEDKIRPFDSKWKTHALYDLLDYLNIQCKIKSEHMVVHCDFWTDGEVIGNMGPCLEFFVDGTQIVNQVYMEYRVDEELVSDLPFRVVDMGIGLQRLFHLLTGETVESSLGLDKKGFDLCRTASHMINSGVTPSKTGLGYNLRWILGRLKSSRTLDACVAYYDEILKGIRPLLEQYNIPIDVTKNKFRTLIQYEYTGC